MRFGWYISGLGHAALILAVLFGGLFAGNRIPEVVTLSDVSILTEEEYAALVPPSAAPDTLTDTPEVAAPVEDAAPETPSEDEAPELSEPEPIDVPDIEEAPEIEPLQAIPEAEVSDTAPPVPAPPSLQDGTVLEPNAVAAPAPRVAPLPQIAPLPEVERAPDVVEDTTPEIDTEPDEPPEDRNPQAPEEASDRIVTEAEEEKTYAPASSKRPRTRPARPRRVTEQPPETTAPATDDAVAAALEQEETRQPSGPPLTASETDAFRLAIQDCFNVGSLSSEALGMKVVVTFDMERTGVPATSSIRMVSFSGGSEAGAERLFGAARRAILRCGARGFNLPVEKYDQWREIEATFNPEGMQFR